MREARILCATLLLLASPALAEPARIAHVVDGDSVHVTMRGERVKVRVAAVDTPEISHPLCPAELARGIAARDFVRALLPVGAEVDVRPTGRTEKYGRLLAAIVLPDGRDLATTVIVAGHGVPYRGGRRRGWCDGSQ